MVNITDSIQVLKDRRVEVCAFASAPLAAAVSVVLPVDAGIAVPILAFSNTVALSGLFLAWRKTSAALNAANRAEARYGLLTERLVRLEQHSKLPAANPALRSTMAEVTGTVGLLGGVVRELAKNVAAQNRDVADLKDTLKAAPKAGEEPREDKPALKVVSEARPAPAALPEKPGLPAPEPSLLPVTRKSSEDELRRMRLVIQAFEADRIELHLQPIVALPQRKIRFYEALARLRLTDGTLLGPSEFLPFIERLGRAPEFDRRVLERSMAVARHLMSRGSEAIVGVNLTPQSVREPGFLWSLVGLVDASQDILGKVVLELPQDSWRELDSDRRAALASLRDRGVPLSLDRASDLDFDARALADLGVRFLKLPAEMMVAAAEQDGGPYAGADMSVRDFASLLRREGIKLVAEHVEREELVPGLIDLGVPLAQGFVFSAPRAVKADVLGNAGPQQPSTVESGRSVLRHAG